MRFLSILVLLVIAALEMTAQTAARSTTVDSKYPPQLNADLEDIAMCHHAIKSAHYQAEGLNQNAYFRYLFMDSFHNYPNPERCEAVENRWVVAYANLEVGAKETLDAKLRDDVGMSLREIASDAEFMSVVTTYKTLGESRWQHMDAPDAIR